MKNPVLLTLSDVCGASTPKNCVVFYSCHQTKVTFFSYQFYSRFFHQLTRNQEPGLPLGGEAGWWRWQSWTWRLTCWRSWIGRTVRTHTIFSEKMFKSHFMVCSLSAIRWRFSSVIEIFPSNLKVLQLILIMHYQELKVTFKTCQNFNNFKMFTKMHQLASGSCEVSIPTGGDVVLLVSVVGR